LSAERVKNQQQSRQLIVLSEQLQSMQAQVKNIEILQERLSRIESQQMAWHNQ
jgi:hypothetical protein